MLEALGEAIHVDELVDLTHGDAEDVRGAGPTDEVDEAIAHHLLLFGVPFAPLAVDVDPDS